jgi:hypothetical protein
MSTTTTLPVLVSTREVLHRNAFQSGPKIAEVQTIQMPDGSLVEVAIWKNEVGKVCRVGAPVTVGGAA